MTDKLIDLISKRFELTEIDTENMKELRAAGMKFTVKAYRAQGLGHVSVMRASGFFGLMKMDTLIVNPTELDLPLYSYDRIYAMGNDTLIVELYDTLLGEFDSSALAAVKENFSSLPERDPGEHWYDSIKLAVSISKKGKKKHTPELDSLTIEGFAAYLDSGKTEVTDKARKLKNAAVYVNGLLEHGGPSTDVFIKTLGTDKTRLLFEKYLFGIKQ